VQLKDRYSRTIQPATSGFVVRAGAGQCMGGHVGRGEGAVGEFRGMSSSDCALAQSASKSEWTEAFNSAGGGLRGGSTKLDLKGAFRLKGLNDAARKKHRVYKRGGQRNLLAAARKKNITDDDKGKRYTGSREWHY